MPTFPQRRGRLAVRVATVTLLALACLGASALLRPPPPRGVDVVLPPVTVVARPNRHVAPRDTVPRAEAVFADVQESPQEVPAPTF